MKKLFGFILLLAGLAFGAFAYYPEALDREAHLAEVTAIIAAPAGDVTRRETKPETTGSLRTFSPSQPVTIPVKPAPAATPAVPAEANHTIVAQAPALPAPAPASSIGWHAIVTPDAGSVPTGVTSSKPGDGHARYELVMNLQRELKRAGCYGGTLTGSWSANTKRAMGAFMERVNSTLPVEEPDYILLTLLKGNINATCASCPLGQTMSDGRCVPKAIIARKTGKQDERRIETAAKPADSGFTTTVAVAEADPTSKVLTTPAPRIAPLPGRMTVGGPRLDSLNAPPASPESWNIKIVPSRAQAPPPAAVVEQTAPIKVPAVTPAPAEQRPASGAPATVPKTPAATPPAATPGPEKLRPAKTRTATLVEEEAASAQPALEEAPAAAQPLPAPAVVPQVEIWPGLPGTKSGPGLPGTKSGPGLPGNTVRSPTFTYTPPPQPRSVYVAPRRERASPPRQRAASNRPQRAHRNTRSVQSLFTHPLGRL